MNLNGKQHYSLCSEMFVMLMALEKKKRFEKLEGDFTENRGVFFQLLCLWAEETLT